MCDQRFGERFTREYGVGSQCFERLPCRVRVAGEDGFVEGGFKVGLEFRGYGLRALPLCALEVPGGGVRLRRLRFLVAEY